MKKTNVKTKKNDMKIEKGTSVIFILDKSGSMTSCWDATISGFNEYLKNLEKEKNKISLSLTLFNTQVESRFVDEKLEKVKKLDKITYVPDGFTALYDAVYRTISEVEEKAKNAGKFLCIIMTDGEENSSKEYTDKDLNRKIKELEKLGNWNFVFMGANQDSWVTGQKMGLNVNNVADYNQTDRGISHAFNLMACKTMSFACSNETSVTNSGTDTGFYTKKEKEDLKKA